MVHPIGRPQRYKRILMSLDEDALYSPSMIGKHAEETGIIEAFLDEHVSLELAKQRIRIAMGRLSNNHKFPDLGDGLVVFEGQAPIPAWYGWRWMCTVQK